jgi:hypothetical protein
MPLLRYFVTIGVLLTALLLVVDAVLEPRKAEIAARASARGEAKLPKPIIKSRRGQDAMGFAQTTPLLEARQPTMTEPRHEPLERASNVGLLASEQQIGRDRLVQESAKRANSKRKTARLRARRNTDVAWSHLNRDPAYSVYAQERPAWPFLAQQRPAASFFSPAPSAHPFFAQRARRRN